MGLLNACVALIAQCGGIVEILLVYSCPLLFTKYCIILSFKKEKDIPMRLNYLLNTLPRQAAFKRRGTGNLQSLNDTLQLEIMEVMQQNLVPASERLHE